VIETKRLLLKIILWVSITILFCLAGGCNTRKTTSPVEPTVYLMKDYFPLNEGDEWIWKVVADSVAEPFIDGDINVGEPFLDMNDNGIYDEGIDSFDVTMDLNENGKYDGPNDPWTPGIPYDDRNGNGEYDPPNGEWDEGEYFTDLDGNGIWNWIQDHYTTGCNAAIGRTTSVSSDGSVIFGRYSSGPGGDFVIRLADDGFSNDTLGLRWHWHSEGLFYPREDDLKEHGPIIIAEARMKVGCSVVNVDTSYGEDEISGIYTWISILERVRHVCVPAGVFKDCLKFRTFASGWQGNMAKYNGTSYQWYAKNVGLVKSEGPKAGECWRLQSAKVGDTSYP
jgi:hypothetical protein